MIPEGNPNLFDSLSRSWTMSVMFSLRSVSTTNQGLGGSPDPKEPKIKISGPKLQHRKSSRRQIGDKLGVFGDSLWPTWTQHFNIFRGSRRSLTAFSRSANKSRLRTSSWSTWLQHFNICRGSRRSLAVVSRSANKSKPRTSSWPTWLRHFNIFRGSGRSLATMGRSAGKFPASCHGVLGGGDTHQVCCTRFG